VGALLRGSVSEGFRHDIAAALHLQTIVADHARGAECFVDITRIQDAAIMIGEYTGQAIRLKLDTDRHLIRSLARYLIGDSEQILDMVSDLMRNDISLSEVPGRAETVTQFLKETRIQIHFLI